MLKTDFSNNNDRIERTENSADEEDKQPANEVSIKLPASLDQKEHTETSHVSSTTSNKEAHTAIKNLPEHHGPCFGDDDHCSDEHKSKKYKQFLPMKRKTTQDHTDNYCSVTPISGMSSAASANILEGLSKTNEADKNSLSLHDQDENMSAQELSFTQGQSSQTHNSSDSFSDSAHSCAPNLAKTPVNQHDGRNLPITNSNNIGSNASQIDETINLSLSEPNMFFPQHEENSAQIEKLAKSLDTPGISIMHVHESHDFITYCASDSQAKVAVKVLKQNDEGKKKPERLKNEHEVTRKISHPSIRKSVQLTKFQKKDAIALEWVEGKTLTECGKLDIKKFLLVAIEILHAVVAIHSNGIMHKNLTTDHIIVNFDPLRINIIGFSLSAGFDEKNLRTMDQVEGDHSFISPEETGKVNRTVDYRSDFYNLGVIFYYMLAGKLPFSSESATDFIENHIFKVPLPLNIVDYSIPKPISDMVDKLMKKNAEDRYQSARGILYDLELMSSEYDVDSSLNSVVLAEHDSSERLLVFQKLYGRSTEFHTLLSAFQRVNAGSTETVFVKGKAGTGKTSFVSELCTFVARKKGYFITGKYDQTQRAEPFSALCEAFRHFFDSILMDNNGNLKHYRSLIQRAVGDEGKVLTDFICNLHLIIGEQPNLAGAVGENSKNRFYYVFCNLMQALCNESHPIVIFLDDLQWADRDSLKLLSALFSTKTVKYLLFIAAYRDDKISETHFLSEAMQEVKKTKVTMNHIKIDNLSSRDVNDLISDALHLPKLDTLPITTFVYEKTQGNAFFVDQILRSLCNEKLLYFSYEEHKWKWDLHKFDSKMTSSSAAQLVLAKILKLDEGMKNVLIAASCIGNPFLLSTLFLLTRDSISVKRVVSRGIILPVNARKTWHRFAHDHIQEAIFSLIPEDDRAATDYKIGKLLWEKCSEKGMEENVFVTVNLLNSGINMIKDQEERLKIARLNLLAGSKAMSSIAFTTALEYLRTGIKFLNKDSWKKDYGLSLKLYNLAAEAALCAKEYSYMHEFTQQIFKNATAFEHKIDCYSIRMRELNICLKYKEVLEMGLHVLAQLGESIPLEPTESFAKEEVQKTFAMIKEKAGDETFMRTIQNDSDTLRMRVLTNLTVSAFYFWAKGVPILASRMVQFSLINGVSKFSAVGFCYFAMVACGKQEYIKEGYQIAQLSLSLLQKFRAKEWLPDVYTCVYGQCAHWYESIHQCIEPLMQGYQAALEVGKNEMAELCSRAYCTYSFWIGKPLENIRSEINGLAKRFTSRGLQFKAVHQAVLNLLGQSGGNPAFLTGEIFDYRKCKEKSDNPVVYSRSLLVCLIIACIFNEYDMALKWAEEFRPYSATFFGGYGGPIYTFYYGLAAVASTKSAKEECNWKTIVHDSMTKLRKWSESSENLMNKFSLLDAEMAAFRKDKSKAMKLFDDAISLSRCNKFMNEEAIAYERAGIFYLEMKCTEKASHFLSQSYHTYTNWGATAKAKQLNHLYPSLIATTNIFRNTSVSPQPCIGTEAFSISTVSEITLTSDIIQS